MDNISIPAWVGKALYAVGIAAVLGTGSTVLGTAERTAVLEAQRASDSTRLERIENKIDRLVERSADEPRK